MAIEFIRPKDLPAASEVNENDSIPVDDGSAVGRATPKEIVDAGRPVASQSEAELGTRNDVAMTPLTTAQAIVFDGAGIRSDAIAARNAAEGYRDEAEGFRDSAQGYATSAGTAAGNAQGYASAAQGYRDAAQGYRNQAESYRNDAEDAKELAQAWAESPDAPGDPGTKSAKTWAEDAADSAASLDALSFDTRASFVAAQSGAASWKDGAVVYAEGIAYRRKAGASDIPGLSGWLPVGDPTPGHFGQPKDVLVPGSPGLQAWANYVAAVSKVGYIDGNYRCDVELDFTQGETVPASGVTIYGRTIGSSLTSIMWNRASTGGQWMVKFNWLQSTEWSSDVLIKDVLFRGYYSSHHKLNRNGILASYNHRWAMENVRVLYHGPVGLYLTQNFNSVFTNVRVSSGGWQSLQREDSLEVSLTDGSTSVSVVSGEVSAADVGRNVYFAKGVRLIEGRDANNGFCASITAVSGPTSFEISRAPSRTMTTTMSFGQVLASVSGDVLSADTDCFDGDDVGAFVWVPSAGTTLRQTHHTTIAEVLSPSSVRIAAAAGNSVLSTPLITSVAVHAGTPPEEYKLNNLGSNDLAFQNFQIEGHQGVGLYLGSGVNVFSNKLKIHGKTYGGGSVAKTGRAIIVNSSNTVLNQTHLEFNTAPPEKGIILMDGERFAASVTDTTIDGFCYGQRIVTAPYTTESWPNLRMTNIVSRIVWDDVTDWMDAGNELVRNQCVLAGVISSPTQDGFQITGTHKNPLRFGVEKVWQRSGIFRHSNTSGVIGPTARGVFFYDENNVVGTVGSESGANRGAVLESLINSTGGYRKFADGSMEIWGRTTAENHDVSKAIGPLYESVEPFELTYSQPFIQTPIINATLRDPNNPNIIGVKKIVGSTSSALISVISAASISDFTLRFNWHAIGRWR